MENENSELLNEEYLVSKIDEIVKDINSDPHPEELERIKKIIRKNVPFSRRGYFSAILLKKLISGYQPKHSEKKYDKPKKQHAEKKETNVANEEKEKKVLPADAKTLYMNVGKMKHLYPKDLSKLLQSELGITRDDIYTLRVHDKYSFVTMSEENCDKAIATLNGKEINGRVAQINYSNK